MSRFDPKKIKGPEMEGAAFSYRQLSRAGHHVKLIKKLAKSTVMMGVKRAGRFGLLIVGLPRLAV